MASPTTPPTGSSAAKRIAIQKAERDRVSALSPSTRKVAKHRVEADAVLNLSASPSVKPDGYNHDMETIKWRRGPASIFEGPAAYYDDEHGYAIFPARGSRDWELCVISEADGGGYVMVDWYPTVAAAKQAVEREAMRERP